MTLVERAPDNLPARISAATARGGTITFVTQGDEERLSWAELHDRALAMAAALQARGIASGDHVAILGPTSRLLVTAIQATWLAGAVAVVLPLPMRMGSIEDFVGQTRARIRSADAALLVVDGDLMGFVELGEGLPPVAVLGDLDRRARRFDPPAISRDSLAVLQFTSGSTADPKGVMLPHRTILANLDAAATAAALDPDEDVLVSWLPLYHDMGLIGLLTLPMITGCDLVLGAPQDFMAAPVRWLEWISSHRGTATAGPNFSYALATRALGRAGRLDLSSWRLALNGAETVDPATMAAFCEAAAGHGFDPKAAFPAFGMAELAIAGTFPAPGSGMVIDSVDRLVLEGDRYAAPVVDAGDLLTPAAPGVRRLARLGRPVPGLEVRVVDPATGSPMRSREVGELEFRGTSVTPGYYGHPSATSEAFRDGWLRTGDLAYLADGELVVCGRIKDVIIVGGRNVFPEDVERAAAEIDGVRAGNVIAFGVDGRKGREALIVVAETKADDPAPLRRAVGARVLEAVGLPAEEIVLVPPGTLPKTSSGKLQRSLCRQQYLEDRLQLV